MNKLPHIIDMDLCIFNQSHYINFSHYFFQVCPSLSLQKQTNKQTQSRQIFLLISIRTHLSPEVTIHINFFHKFSSKSLYLYLSQAVPSQNKIKNKLKQQKAIDFNKYKIIKWIHLSSQVIIDINFFPSFPLVFLPGGAVLDHFW